MSARFKKLDDTTWGVSLEQNDEGKAGDTVTVTKRDGTGKQVVLGEEVGTNKWGDRLFRVAPKAEVDDGLTRIEGPGAFEHGGVAYIVKPTKDGERLYAKRVVEINADRLNEADGIVQIELVYEKGAMAFLREEHRLDEDRAKELSVRYGRCIVCGRHLKAAESVERGIGPVCFGRLAQRQAVPA